LSELDAEAPLVKSLFVKTLSIVLFVFNLITAKKVVAIVGGVIVVDRLSDLLRIIFEKESG
jgi:hypothetical protein